MNLGERSYREEEKKSRDYGNLSDAHIRYVSVDVASWIESRIYHNCMHVHRSLRPVVKATAKDDMKNNALHVSLEDIDVYICANTQVGIYTQLKAISPIRINV